MDKNREQDNPKTQDPDILKKLVRFVVKAKSAKSLIVNGGPDTGKTDTVTETLKEEGLVQNKDWFMIEGRVTPFRLYQILFKHRKGGILIFRGTDSIWSHRDAVLTLKSALDDDDESRVGWGSRRTRSVYMMSREAKEAYNDKVDQEMQESLNDRKVKLPSEFSYRGKAIFISNLPKERFAPEIRARSLIFDMTLSG